MQSQPLIAENSRSSVRNMSSVPKHEIFGCPENICKHERIKLRESTSERPTLGKKKHPRNSATLCYAKLFQKENASHPPVLRWIGSLCTASWVQFSISFRICQNGAKHSPPSGQYAKSLDTRLPMQFLTYFCYLLPFLWWINLQL